MEAITLSDNEHNYLSISFPPSVVDVFSLVCGKLKPELLDKAYQELELNFRIYARAIVTIAANLHRSRELK